MPRRASHFALLGPIGPALLLSACANKAPPSTLSAPVPPSAAPSAKTPPPPSSRLHGVLDSTRSCIADAANSDPLKRQYCDKKKRRFYYFDPIKKQYFWDNGQPWS